MSRASVLVAIAVTILAGSSRPAFCENDGYQRAPDLAQASLEELLGMEVDQVFSASRSVQNVRRAPASVTIVTAEDIRRFGFTTLADALRSTTGFYTTSDRNYTYLGVRGFGLPGDYNSRVLVLIDGFRYNDGIYNQALLTNDFPIDVGLIDRIEIIRGPSSSLYGSNAFFAVINVMTSRGQSREGVNVEVHGGALATGAGRVTAGGRTARGVEYLFSQSAGRSDGQSRLYFPAYDSPDTLNGVAENMDREVYQNGFVKASHRGMTVSAGWVSRTKRVPTASFGTVFGDPRFETTDGHFFTHLDYGRTVAPGTEIGARVSVDATRYSGIYPYDDGAGSYVQDDRASGNGWGGELLVKHHFPRGHEATGGMEVRRDFTLDQYYQWIGGPADETPLDSRHSLWSWGLFAQDEFPLGRDVVVNAGARVDHYESFGTTVNPRLGLIIGSTRRSTVKLLYGCAFRAPDPYELFYWPMQGKLRPETIATVEAVWEQQLGERVRTSVSVFHNTINDLILQTSLDQPIGSMTPIVFANLEHARAHGVDSSLDLRWPSGLLLRIGYTLVDADSVETGSVLSNAPWNLVKTAAIVPLGSGGATLGLEGEYVGARYTIGRELVDGHFRQNAALNVPAGRGAFRLTVGNLFDRKWVDPVGSEVQSGVVAQDGRTALATFSYRF